MNHAYAFARLVVCGLAFLYIIITQWLARRDYHHAVAYLLVLFYTVMATGIIWSWGINTPIGTLIFGLVIVLAGILLTARHAVYAAVMSGMILLGVQVAGIYSWHNPDTSWTGEKSDLGDVMAYCIVFGMLGLVSWLYNREMEQSLVQTEQARLALLHQKSTLRKQVKERTEELRRLQLEEMRQMYHFAKLGQLGAILLHDLANHLTALTLEIEDMESKRHDETISRVQQIIRYLDDIVENTREQIQGGSREETFDIIRTTSDTVAFLHYKAARAGVTIDWEPAGRTWQYKGDPYSLGQVIAIITSNAIDAYTLAPSRHYAQERRVSVDMSRTDAQIIIRITDWGRGITKVQQKQLFKPSHSTKKSGLGLGLYIAKQTVEMQFSGTIVTTSSKDSTDFIIRLPLDHAR